MTTTTPASPLAAEIPGAPASGTHSIEVAEAEAGERVDRLIARRLPALSRSRVKGLIEAGALSSGGATIDEPSTRVQRRGSAIA